MEFYERLEMLRKSIKKSQREIENELGFSTGSYGKWKNSMPTPDRLKKLADYFGVTSDYLMTGEKTDNKEIARIDVELSVQSKEIKEYMLKFAKLPDDKRKQIMSLIDMLED